MKKSALTKLHKLVFGFVLLVGLLLAGSLNQNLEASLGGRTVHTIADSGGTAGQRAKTDFKRPGTAGQQM